MFDYNTSNIVILFVSLAFIAVAMTLIFFAVKDSLEEDRIIKARLAGNWKEKDPERVLQGNQAIERFSNHLTLPDQTEITKIRAQLARAGFYKASSVKTYYAIRVLCIVMPQIMFLIGFSLFFPKMDHSNVVMICCLLIALGFAGPPLFLSKLESMRRLQVQNGFPDMMDLLVACIEAGMGLNAALLRVAKEVGGRYPVLKINLDLLNMELRAGRERHVAMSNFANRVNLEEARSLSVMLRQAEEMGTSMGLALRTFSDDMRNKRMMRAEEKAMALPAKLTVPLILFIFPTIMIMLLLPAGVRIARGMAGI